MHRCPINRGSRRGCSMDGSKFDQFARDLAAAPSRRSLLKATLGLGFGSVAAVLKLEESTAARSLRKPGEICQKNGDCASGRCSGKDATGRSRCLCASAVDCPRTKAGDVCRGANCSVAGICGFAVNTGAACNDGDACTINDVCLANGRCAGAPAPVDCVVDDWGDWGRCSARCGGGTRQRTRSVLTPASCGGAACPALTESLTCNTMICGPCSETQINSNACSTYTFIDSAQVCTGGGAVGAPPCCATDADCPVNTPFCVISFTAATGSHELHLTHCPTNDAQGLCSGYVACSVAP